MHRVSAQSQSPLHALSLPILSASGTAASPGAWKPIRGAGETLPAGEGDGSPRLHVQQAWCGNHMGLPCSGLVWLVRARLGGRCRMKIRGVVFPGNLVKSQAENSRLVASGALRKTRAKSLHPLSSHPQLISGVPLGGHLKKCTSDRSSN